MKKNLGTLDKIIRITLALVLLGLYTTEIIAGTLGYIGLALASIFLLTSILNFCPLYAVVGIKTCKTNV